jgi:hypothetical protein
VERAAVRHAAPWAEGDARKCLAASTLQACQQGAIILFWGYYWREVYHAAPLIAAQLLFACGFDSLLSWTHRRTFVLGFGPFPIIFSISLFFWFKDDWFYPQFASSAFSSRNSSAGHATARTRTSSTPRHSRSPWRRRSCC